MPSKLELLGERFGRLLVISESGRDRHGAVMWFCLCDCGNATVVRGSQLTHGVTQSCGCGIAAAASKPRTHGQSRSPLWIRWRAMRDRCENPNKKGYADYGGRGIKVCERWLAFENFAADMGPTFNPSLELDRYPDNDGNYEPGNCRWATRSEQQLNRRSNHRVAWRGVTLTVKEWSARLGIKPNTIIYRLKRGWLVDRALSTGVDSRVLLELANQSPSKAP